MKFLSVSILSEDHKESLLRLWNKEYPVDLQYREIADFKVYLEKLDDQHHRLLVDENDRITGWYSDFQRDGERWFLVILDSKIHHNGFGTQLMKLAKKDWDELNGWVIIENHYLKADGEIYLSPIQFYIKNGFKIIDNIQLDTGKITATKITWKN